MSNLTFGIELEMFISFNKNIYQLIAQQIENHTHVKNIQDLINYIYTNKFDKDNPFHNYNQDTSLFIHNLINNNYTNIPLSEQDSYIIILILTYIICNGSPQHSFTLNIDPQKKSPLFFNNCKSNINWYYDPDITIQYHPNIPNYTYKTIKDKKYGKLLCDNHIPFIEFVSSVFDDSTQVKNGIDLLFNSLIKTLKLNIFHSIQTSNHIHFSIKQHDKSHLGIRDPKIIFKITYVFYVLQNLIYLMCLPSRRTSPFCNPLHTDFDIDSLTINDFFDKLVSLQRSSKFNTHFLTELDINSILQSLKNQIAHMDSRINSRFSKIKKNKLFYQSSSSSHSQSFNKKQLLLKIDNLDRELIKFTTINSDSYSRSRSSSLSNTSSSPINKIIAIPFKNLTFNDQLTFLMHLYQNNTSYSYNTHLDKHTFHIEPTYRTSRYSILNLKKLSLDQSCTLELRAKHGSNDSTEIKFFCELIQSFYNIALQLDDNTPLLLSLSKILKINIRALKTFKNSHSTKIADKYDLFTKPPLCIVHTLLKGLFGGDNTTIQYWLKHLDTINKI